MLEDISNSIRSASNGVEALKAKGTAELTFQNKDPGTWTFDLTGNLGTKTITTEITGEDPSESDSYTQLKLLTILRDHI